MASSAAVGSASATAARIVAALASSPGELAARWKSLLASTESARESSIPPDAPLSSSPVVFPADASARVTRAYPTPGIARSSAALTVLPLLPAGALSTPCAAHACAPILASSSAAMARSVASPRRRAIKARAESTSPASSPAAVSLWSALSGLTDSLCSTLDENMR